MGASADTLVSTISTASSNRMKIRGSNQNFFLVFKKANNSFRNSMSKRFQQILPYINVTPGNKDRVRSLFECF